MAHRLQLMIGTASGACRCRQPISLARGASDEWDTAMALPLIAVSSQNVIGSFEARFFCAQPDTHVATGV